MPVPKFAGARCKKEAIHNALSTKGLEPVRVSGFRHFPSNGENSEGMSVQVAAPAASAYLRFKSIFVDSQALDFCFEGGIGDA